MNPSRARTASLEELQQLPPDAEQVGALVDFANAVPRELLMVLLPSYLQRAKELCDRDGAGGDGRELRRHLVVLGALLNRLLFDVLDLPQDRDFIIR